MMVFNVSRSISFPANPESSFNRIISPGKQLPRIQLPSSIFNFSARAMGIRSPMARAKIFLMLREHNLGRSKPAKNNILDVQRQFFDTADGILNPGTHAMDDVKIGLQFLTEHPDW